MFLTSRTALRLRQASGCPERCSEARGMSFSHAESQRTHPSATASCGQPRTQHHTLRAASPAQPLANRTDPGQGCPMSPCTQGLLLQEPQVPWAVFGGPGGTQYGGGAALDLQVGSDPTCMQLQHRSQRLFAIHLPQPRAAAATLAATRTSLGDTNTETETNSWLLFSNGRLYSKTAFRKMIV